MRYADDAVMLFENDRHGQQTAWSVRAAAPPGQDAVPGLPTESAPRARAGRGIRLPRLHPLLGAVAEGISCRAPDHGQEPLRTRDASRVRLVSQTPARRGPQAAGVPRERAAGARELLRAQGQQRAAIEFPLPGRADVAEVAIATQPEIASELGQDAGTPTEALCRGLASGPPQPLRFSLERTCHVKNRVR